MLQAIGYRASPAADARTALSILASEHVDVLLTDVGLPDMSGETLAELAISQKPHLAIIFATGQAAGIQMPATTTSFTLVKPFSFDALAAAVASVESKLS